MVQKNQFVRKFTEEDVLNALAAESPATSLNNIAARMGCSDQTVAARISILIASGKVVQRNVGTENKPTYIYYLK